MNLSVLKRNTNGQNVFKTSISLVSWSCITVLGCCFIWCLKVTFTQACLSLPPGISSAWPYPSVVVCPVVSFLLNILVGVSQAVPCWLSLPCCWVHISFLTPLLSSFVSPSPLKLLFLEADFWIPFPALSHSSITGFADGRITYDLLEAPCLSCFFTLVCVFLCCDLHTCCVWLSLLDVSGHLFSKQLTLKGSLSQLITNWCRNS